MATKNPYYEGLLEEVFKRQTELDPLSVLPKTAGIVGATKFDRVRKMLSSPGLKAGVGSLVAWMALDRLLEARNIAASRKVQREAIRGQAELVTPENLYLQAALPTAQTEEETARQALFTHILGGVTGPSLARGERLISG